MVDEIKIGIVQVYHTAAVTLGASLIAVALLFFSLNMELAWDAFTLAIAGILLIVVPSFLAEKKIKQAKTDWYKITNLRYTHHYTHYLLISKSGIVI